MRTHEWGRERKFNIQQYWTNIFLFKRLNVITAVLRECWMNMFMILYTYTVRYSAVLFVKDEDKQCT